MIKARAVVLDQPQRLRLTELPLSAPGESDVVVQVSHSGISTGNERLLWNGCMPSFPGLAYPLVPGDESVGEVVWAGSASGRQVGTKVFVPGARCFGEVRALHGGAASTLVVPGARVEPLMGDLGDMGQEAVLLAMAATAYHAVAQGGKREVVKAPELIVGHGVLGRLLARLTVAAGLPAPTVWELDSQRQSGGQGYEVIRPQDDPRHDYQAIYDVSGDARILDQLIGRLSPGGEVVLAGFYAEPLSFAFAPAFLREATIRAAAEWQRPDLLAVKQLVASGQLSLAGLITHQFEAPQAAQAYATAFSDTACLKTILDWRACA